MDEDFSLFNDIGPTEDEAFEDYTLFEKLQNKVTQLKEDFLHLAVVEKIALIVAISTLFTILGYALFTFSKLTYLPTTRVNTTKSGGSTTPTSQNQTNSTTTQNSQNQTTQNSTTQNQP